MHGQTQPSLILNGKAEDFVWSFQIFIKWEFTELTMYMITNNNNDFSNDMLLLCSIHTN